MSEELETDIYATLIGVIDEKHRISGVENAFAPGSYCDRRYQDMMDCRQRLWERLGSEDDEDVERLIMAMESIQTALCIKMFRLGQRFPPLKHKTSPIRLDGALCLSYSISTRSSVSSLLGIR